MIPKFRVWDRARNEMNYKVMVGNCDTDDENWTCPIIWIEEEKDWLHFDDYECIMQSTGLKDKNGKEIFEGDVVRMRNPRDRRQIGMFQVVRVANSPMLGLLCKKLTTEVFNLYEHMRNYYEVKGNIYENPEILEEK
ncbi:phage protein [Streptococcus pneumoniae]|uniref:YopX family protein n=2 Tax=Streptococcus pneumoniae TaxID=1313 RepID=UPI0005DA67CC|nr:YopX family protein [Streptococcus pneumoniae]CAG6114410.1 phage protein [Streptococcus pneumoniae]CAG6314629.1 phage protein [Streptococcus pneumoniae]CFQ38139.1 phage protein [Streptococcus pneumoniae]CMV69539.1 phage protein [Streptococcus pneumoniae]CMX50137.1 phage protein [Streptococcus pneumoniae]